MSVVLLFAKCTLWGKHYFFIFSLWLLDPYPLHYFCISSNMIIFCYNFNKFFALVLSLALHEKSYFLFINVLKRWSSQNIALEYDLSCIIRKDDIIFSKIWSYFLDGKWKIIFFNKIHENMIFSANVLKRWSSKKSRLGIWSFLYCQERLNFFFPTIDGKWKTIFLKKIHGNMTFSANVLKWWSFQKNCTGIWSYLYYQETWYFFFS